MPAKVETTPALPSLSLVGGKPVIARGSVKNLGRYAASGIAWRPKRPSSTAALT